MQARPARRQAVGGLAEHDRKQVGDRAFLDPQGAVHIGFAELDLGIEQHAAFGGAGHEAHRNRRPAAFADSEYGTARRREPEVPRRT